MEPISALVSAVTAAREVTKAAVGVRDFNASATALARVNEQLLDVLDKALSTKAYAIELQHELADAKAELRRLQELADERRDYVLHAVFHGVFAYRYQPAEARADDRQTPAHFLCQPCFDKGTKAVLVRANDICWWCPTCKTSYVGDTDRRPKVAIGHDDDPFR